MRTGRVGRRWKNGLGFGLALGALTLAAAAAPAAATTTQRTQSTDCRCVDTDGNAIADCTCIRMPRFDRMDAPFVVTNDRPRLGISVSTTQGSERDAQGAYVTNVLEDGPAWNAGIREGDVITEIDGRSLFQPLSRDVEDDFDLDESIPVQRLLAIARELEPGSEVEVTYLRDGDERSATVSAEDLSDRAFSYVVPEFDAERFRDQLRDLNQDVRGFRWQGAAPAVPAVPGEPIRLFGRGPDAVFFEGSSFGRFGLEIVELNPGLGQYFGTEEGILVVNVEEGTALGLRPGDVILSVGERPVSATEDVRRILGSYEDDETIPMRVRRDGREISVMGRLGN